MIKKLFTIFALLFYSFSSFAQADPLIEKVSKKLALVNDYVGEGVMKTDVSFIKASLGKVKVYFKKPNLLKVKKDGGISLLPKGGVSLTINTLLNTKQYSTISAGTQVLNGKTLTVLKLIPTDENLDWVIATLWIDPVEALVYKTATTTKDMAVMKLRCNMEPMLIMGWPVKLFLALIPKTINYPTVLL